MDFEKRIRDQTMSRSPTSTAQQETESDLIVGRSALWGGFSVPEKPDVSAAVRKSVASSMATSLTTAPTPANPGGTDVFGRAASTENPGFRVERFWTALQVCGHARDPVRGGRAEDE